MTRRLLAGVALALLAASPAAAQRQGGGAFFAGDVQDEEDLDETTYDGSLTSTTFYYRESAGLATPPNGGAGEIEAASPIDRFFTDLRGQLTADHIGGSSFDFRGDVRGRLTGGTYANSDGQFVPFQTGTFHGQEIELRELFLRRDGQMTDISVGRQYVLELAATKFDGAKVEVETSRAWKFLLFGGLYPSRISRDIGDDYPTQIIVQGTTVTEGSRLFPVTGGAGTAYRFPSVYGSLGVVGILPRADDNETQTAEETRVFATANGYWRPTSKVDFFHYIVADAAGAGGAGLTNLNLGVNIQPAPSLRAYAVVNRTDTETLNVFAQTKLEDPNPVVGDGFVQNNIEVQRIAQESLRVGLSANFDERVEVSASGALRRRGELRFEPIEGDPEDAADDVVFPAAQAADVTLGVVDRKSVADMRLGASITSSFGVGSANLNRNRVLVGRIDGSKVWADGRAEIEASVTYLNSADENGGTGTGCNLSAGIETCFGSTEGQSLTGGLLLFYRFSQDWFVVGNVNLGAQMSTAVDMSGNPQDQPTILTTALLLRLAYRF